MAIHPVLTGSVSFVVLVFASWCVGEGGEILGQKYDASIVGGLVIAWLNTAPETIFFVTALNSDNPRFAVGAVSGSTIVVCTIAMGMVVFFGTKARMTESFTLQTGVKQQALILCASCVIPLSLCTFGCSTTLGVLGVGAYAGFLIYQILRPKEIYHPAGHGASALDASDKDIELAEIKDDEMKSHVNIPTPNKEEISEEEPEQPTYKGVGFLVLGGALICIFSEPFITSVVTAANLANVNPILFAFFLAPVASEMPEILESISLSRKGKLQNLNIAVSNLLGGTITKTTFLCGIFAFYGVYKQFPWESPNYTISYALLLICAIIASFPLYYFHTQQRWNAIVLFASFVVAGVFQYFFNSTYTDSDAIKSVPDAS